MRNLEQPYTASSPAELTPVSFKKGDMVGSVRVLSELGMHDNALILAGETEDGELAALKIPLNDKGVEEVLHEGAMLQELKGEDEIVDVIGMEEEAGRPVLVTHLQEGGDLSSMIRPDAPADIVDHSQLQAVEGELDAHVQSMEANGDDEEVGIAYSEIMDKIAISGTLKEIAAKSSSVDSKLVLEKVAEAAEEVGEDIDPDGYVAQVIARDVVAEADKTVIQGTQEKTLPNQDDVKGSLAVLHSVAVGLKAMHASGLVHLDIKDGNIFVNSKGEGKIGDLASARKIGTKIDLEDYKASNENMPYEIYMPEAEIPEDEIDLTPDADKVDSTGEDLMLQDEEYSMYHKVEGLDRTRTYDAKIDSFGLGAVVFKAITGSKAFTVPQDNDRERAATILESVLYVDTLIEQMEKGTITGELGAVVVRSLSSKSEERPTDDEWIAALAA